MRRSRFVARAGVIAAIYGALTYITITVGQSLAVGPVQFRVSEAVTVLAAFTPAAVPGLFLGSALANLTSVAAFGPLGMLDVVFGSLASALGAIWTWRFRRNIGLALAGPVIANALIVPAYLPVMLGASGVTQIPLLGITLPESWLAAYAFGIVTVGLGEAIVVYALGLPLWAVLRMVLPGASASESE